MTHNLDTNIHINENASVEQCQSVLSQSSPGAAFLGEGQLKPKPNGRIATLERELKELRELAWYRAEDLTELAWYHAELVYSLKLAALHEQQLEQLQKLMQHPMMQQLAMMQQMQQQPTHPTPGFAPIQQFPVQFPS